MPNLAPSMPAVDGALPSGAPHGLGFAPRVATAPATFGGNRIGTSLDAGGVSSQHPGRTLTGELLRTPARPVSLKVPSLQLESITEEWTKKDTIRFETADR